MPTLVIIGLFAVLLVAIIGGFITQWVKLNNENSQNKRLQGRADRELRQENDALRKHIDQVYDRIETLERIVTDKPSRLAEEIDKLDALPPRPKREQERGDKE